MTQDQIRKLRDEAAEAGDDAQVQLCELALGGDELAWKACAMALADARAMAELSPDDRAALADATA